MKKEIYISIISLLILSSSAFAQEISVFSDIHIYNGAYIGVYDNMVNEEDTLLNEGHLSLLKGSLENYVPITGTGTLEISGDDLQKLTGGSEIKIDTLFLNNSSNDGIVFDNNIYIQKRADFTSGILADDDLSDYGDPRDLFFVKFESGAEAINVSDNSYVEGLVKKEGMSEFYMPIGDKGYYRPLYLYESTENVNYSAKYFLKDNNFPETQVPNYKQIDRAEYWFLDSDKEAFSFDISYSEDVSEINIERPNLLAAAKYNGLLDDDVAIEEIVEDPDLSDTNFRYFRVAVNNEATKQTDFGEALWFGYATSIPQGGEFPQFLTPNGDNINDVFDVPERYLYVDNKIEIFNRYGNLVFKQSQYNNDWDGKPNQSSVGGTDGYLPTGTYFVLFYEEGKLIYKSFVQLLLSN